MRVRFPLGLQGEAAPGRLVAGHPDGVAAGLDGPGPARAGGRQGAIDVVAAEHPDDANRLSRELRRTLHQVPDRHRARLRHGRGGLRTEVLPEDDLVVRAVRGRRRAPPENARHLDLLSLPVAGERRYDVGELRLRRHPEPAALVSECEPLPAGQDLDRAAHAHGAALEEPGVREQVRDRNVDRPPAERLVDPDARRRNVTEGLPDALHREAHVARDLRRDDARLELDPRERRGPAHREGQTVGADERRRDFPRDARRQRRRRVRQPARVRERDEQPPVAWLALDLQTDEPQGLVPDRAHAAE